MPLLFTYGSLKQGFPNEHVNTGVRVPGVFRTRLRLPLLLIGAGHVPCLVHVPGQGHQVVGEVYDVDARGLAAIDRLERVGEPGGYRRVAIDLERSDADAPPLAALVYVREPEAVAGEPVHAGPLVEYLAEHAQRLHW